MSPLTRSDSLAALAKAKAVAQARFLPLGKGKSATVQLKSGGSYSYDYADLAACLESVIPALSEAGIAVFQPVRIEDGSAIATTLLVHGESGEWIASDYTAIAVDARDARSVGSASTYARRYGLLAMLAIASSDEDDDGEEARGGAHEMPQAREQRPSAICPACGKDAIIKGKAEWGGGWVCFKKKGGCGLKWPEGPFPDSATPKWPEGPFHPKASAPDSSMTAEQLFETPGEEAARKSSETATLLSAITKRWDGLKTPAALRMKQWHQHCGEGDFLSPATDVAALAGLLEALGSHV